MTDGFGKYAILTPVEHTFEQDNSLKISFRSPTSSDELFIGQFVSTQIPMPGNTPPFRYPNTAEVMFFELAILYAGSNIEGAPKPAVIPMSEIGVSRSMSPDFIEVHKWLQGAPIVMMRELWAHISEAVPGWGPEKKALTSTAPKSA